MCFIMWTKQKVSFLTMKRPYMLHNLKNTKSKISIKNCKYSELKKKILSRCFIMWKKLLYNVEKVWYFFISPEKLIFDHFSAKFEWVREKVFFFSRPLKMSEWVKCKLFQEKKNNNKKNIFFEKKNTSKMWKTAFFAFFWPFLTFFWGHPLFWRVSGLQTFAMKKKLFLLFFFNYYFFLE